MRCKKADRQSWNERYSTSQKPARPPDPFLLWAYQAFVSPTFPQGGVALDLAGGAGRHSLWLAHRNWNVTLVDFSETAIKSARQNAAADAKQINFRVQAAEDFLTSDAVYDLVLVFFFLDRSLFARIEQSLRPGGFLLYKTFTTEQQRFHGGPSNPDHLLQPGELAKAFPGLRTIHSAEIVADDATAEIVARKLT